jgi:hypothetical protein
MPRCREKAMRHVQKTLPASGWQLQRQASCSLLRQVPPCSQNLPAASTPCPDAVAFNAGLVEPVSLWRSCGAVAFFSLTEPVRLTSGFPQGKYSLG